MNLMISLWDGRGSDSALSVIRYSPVVLKSVWSHIILWSIIELTANPAHNCPFSGSLAAH